jgi:predicted transcriptional regulator
MKRDIKSPIKPVRLKGLPEGIRRELKQARLKHGWSQAELGRRANMSELHTLIARYRTATFATAVYSFVSIVDARKLN